MKSTQLINHFQKARTNPKMATIEGVQALKHAARFGAKFEQIITCDLTTLTGLIEKLAPDTNEVILSMVEEVSEDTFTKLSPQPPRTKVIALARRKQYKLSDLDPAKLVVLLEDPRDLENIGAVIRVSAAADAAGVCITGPADIWHPAVIRGAAGLQFALPVLNIDLNKVKGLKRPLISLDPTGKLMESDQIKSSSILIFGTERHGISNSTLNMSDKIIRLPMKDGVSSLNLATSVAATLYKM